MQFEATIEAKGELNEVTTEVLSLACLTGAMKGVLHVAQHLVEPVELSLFNAGRFAASRDAPVTTSFDNGPKALESIRGHF